MKLFQDLWIFLLNVAIVLIVLMFVYWTFEKDPYQITNIAQPKPVLKSGDRLEYAREICSTKDNIEAYGFISVMDENNFSWPLYQGLYPPQTSGCRVIGLSRFIPSNLPNGHYRYNMVLLYKKNAIRSVKKILEPVEFEVRNGE